MARYLLLMRGDQARFAALPAREQGRIIAEHRAYSDRLETEGRLEEGDGLAFDSLLLRREGGRVSRSSRPFAGTEQQLSGFYIVEAADDEAALVLAEACPALLHGESVELVRLGH